MSFLTLDCVSHYQIEKKTYSKIIDNVSISVKEGDFVTILGPNGCGKSTLLSIMAGNIQPTAGTIQLSGKKETSKPTRVGWVMENDYLLSWRTVMGNLYFRKQKKQRESASNLLKAAKLSKFENHFPRSLSNGERQCVSFLRALVHDPHLILLDEPFRKLDYLEKHQLEETIIKLLRKHRTTTVLATHDADEAIVLSDRIIILNPKTRTVSRTFEVPIELRQEIPLYARKHPKYQLLFDKLTQELHNGDIRSTNRQDGEHTV